MFRPAKCTRVNTYRTDFWVGTTVKRWTSNTKNRPKSRSRVFRKSVIAVTVCQHSITQCNGNGNYLKKKIQIFRGPCVFERWEVVKKYITHFETITVVTRRLLVTSYFTAPVLCCRPSVVPHKLRLHVFLRTARRALMFEIQ